MYRIMFIHLIFVKILKCIFHELYLRSGKFSLFLKQRIFNRFLAISTTYYFYSDSI
jgi:hypothetical protein